MHKLPDNTASKGRPLRRTAEQARQTVCKIQRACPASNHLAEKKRKILPCAETREQLETYLGKT